MFKRKRFRCFTRAWWRRATQGEPGWPNNLVPNSGGRKTTFARCYTEDEARDICRTWNANHKPGRYSRKAEFEEC